MGVLLDAVESGDRYVRRPDGLVRILHPSDRRHGRRSFSKVFLAELLLEHGARFADGVVREASGVGADVSDVPGLIEVTGELRGLLRCPTPAAARRLEQRIRRERGPRLLRTLARLRLAHAQQRRGLQSRAAAFGEDSISGPLRVVLARLVHPPSRIVRPVKAHVEIRAVNRRDDLEVGNGDVRLTLELPLDDEAQSWRLNPPHRCGPASDELSSGL